MYTFPNTLLLLCFEQLVTPGNSEDRLILESPWYNVLIDFREHFLATHPIFVL